jgi:ribosomal protein L11 methyltransferase
MLALFAEGFEEKAGSGWVELAAYTDSAGEARARAAFREVSASPVSPGWRDEWRRFHRPVRVGPLWIGPPWERPDHGALAVVVDPGRAFGTGAHPTTRLVLELLLACPRGSVLDLGCGSGVLGVAAARLGFAPVLSLDSDPVAVDAARVNAAANGVALEVRLADVLADELPPADVALTNIEIDPVEQVAKRLDASALLTSGYRARDRLELLGWTHRERRTDRGWAADRFERA